MRTDGLTLRTLRALLSYDPGTGVFCWRTTRIGRCKAGSIAGSPNSNGYSQICVAGHLVKAHRLAWFYVHGAWPSAELDHRDRNRQNNAIANLRLATSRQNAANRDVGSRNTSGVRGASLTRTGKWRATIKVSGKTLSLGCFDSPHDASAAYEQAAKLHFGEFAL